MTAAITKINTQDLTTRLPIWQPAPWEEYVAYRDDPTDERLRLYFYQDRLLVEMGHEGINHASISDLFTMLFFIWFANVQNKFLVPLDVAY